MRNIEWYSNVLKIASDDWLPLSLTSTQATKWHFPLDFVSFQSSSTMTNLRHFSWTYKLQKCMRFMYFLFYQNDTYVWSFNTVLMAETISSVVAHLLIPTPIPFCSILASTSIYKLWIWEIGRLLNYKDRYYFTI